MKSLLMLKALYFTLALAALLTSNVVSAQSTRSLSGTLAIDVGTNDIDRDIKITVNNHSFLVVPPTFAITRPITSSESTIVRMLAGTPQVNYTINNIITDPVDYSVSIRCVGCENDIPTQYYRPDGNAFGLVNSAYIDPDDLPAILNLTALSRATIEGEIVLNQASERGLRFRLTVFGSENTDRVFKTLSPITIASGTTSVSYSIRGLTRATGSDQYRVKLECLNCLGSSRRALVFASALSPTQNHSQVNFLATDLSIPVLAPIIQLLLD